MSAPLVECTQCGAGLDESQLMGTHCPVCRRELPLVSEALRQTLLERGERRLLVRPGGIHALFGEKHASPAQPPAAAPSTLEGLAPEQRARLLRWADDAVTRRKQQLGVRAERTLIATVGAGLLAVCGGALLTALGPQRYQVDVPVGQSVKPLAFAPWLMIGVASMAVGLAAMLIGSYSLRSYQQSARRQAALLMLVFALLVIVGAALATWRQG